MEGPGTSPERVLDAAAEVANGDSALLVTLAVPAPQVLASLRGLIRRFVEHLGRGGYGEDAVLVATELTANAILHGRSPVRVLVTTSGPGLLVAAFDGESGPLVVAGESRRGLGIVQRVAGGRCGSSVRVDGKWVWAELGLPTSPPAFAP